MLRRIHRRCDFEHCASRRLWVLGFESRSHHRSRQSIVGHARTEYFARRWKHYDSVRHAEMVALSNRRNFRHQAVRSIWRVLPHQEKFWQEPWLRLRISMASLSAISAPFRFLNNRSSMSAAMVEAPCSFEAAVSSGQLDDLRQRHRSWSCHKWSGINWKRHRHSSQSECSDPERRSPRDERVWQCDSRRHIMEGVQVKADRIEIDGTVTFDDSPSQAFDPMLGSLPITFGPPMIFNRR